nr:unnamed protein product [Digitaria exilis]
MRRHLPWATGGRLEPWVKLNPNPKPSSRVWNGLGSSDSDLDLDLDRSDPPPPPCRSLLLPPPPAPETRTDSSQSVTAHSSSATTSDMTGLARPLGLTHSEAILATLATASTSCPRGGGTRPSRIFPISPVSTAGTANSITFLGEPLPPSSWPLVR